MRRRSLYQERLIEACRLVLEHDSQEFYSEDTLRDLNPHPEGPSRDALNREIYIHEVAEANNVRFVDIVRRLDKVYETLYNPNPPELDPPSVEDTIHPNEPWPPQG